MSVGVVAGSSFAIGLLIGGSLLVVPLLKPKSKPDGATQPKVVAETTQAAPVRAKTDGAAQASAGDAPAKVENADPKDTADNSSCDRQAWPYKSPDCNGRRPGTDPTPGQRVRVVGTDSTVPAEVESGPRIAAQPPAVAPAPAPAPATPAANTQPPAPTTSGVAVAEQPAPPSSVAATSTTAPAAAAPPAQEATTNAVNQVVPSTTRKAAELSPEMAKPRDSKTAKAERKALKAERRKRDSGDQDERLARRDQTDSKVITRTIDYGDGRRVTITRQIEGNDGRGARESIERASRATGERSDRNRKNAGEGDDGVADDQQQTIGFADDQGNDSGALSTRRSGDKRLSKSAITRPSQRKRERDDDDQDGIRVERVEASDDGQQVAPDDQDRFRRFRPDW
jgi:hypothetical protein